ncbi:gastrula zinc finger protein XlCGF46.1-like [Drosophila innubila]|uniref:gastrula zinc finger protein XlCGF46.1-like n=1 Tax=Drosophila innubila TaxID=198719 RepID=UPI00148DFFF8|nr:gastrula zinc finger protein XlCGF46.1-like [Drosophila innubila]
MTSLPKCRVCICSLAAEAEFYDMRKLPRLAHKFVTCTDLSFSEEERLPSELCQGCHDQLERLYAFRARCIAADTKWRMEILAFCEDTESIEDNEQLKSTDEITELETNAPKAAAITELQPAHEEAPVAAENITQIPTVNPENISEEVPPQSKSIYKCDICATQFLEEHRLQAHKRQHGLMPYPCPEPDCDRGYSHKNTLSVHMRKCHKLGKEHKSHVCEFCGKTFDTMWRLKNHRFTHKDKSELPYVCEDAECGRRFSSKQLLKVHMMRHAGIKNYRCTYCGVQKTTRTELKIHLNYHTLERTYCCRICSKVCNSSSNLNLHMRTVHERSKNYPCTYCDRSFNQPSLRKQHELIHTGEKPHECEECGRHFRQKAALRTHRKIHEREIPPTQAQC